MTAFNLSRILSYRFNIIRSQLETVFDFWLVLNVCMKECDLIKGGHTFELITVIDRLRNDSAAAKESGIATYRFLPSPLPSPHYRVWSQARTETTEGNLMRLISFEVKI